MHHLSPPPLSFSHTAAPASALSVTAATRVPCCRPCTSSWPAREPETTYESAIKARHVMSAVWPWNDGEGDEEEKHMDGDVSDGKHVKKHDCVGARQIENMHERNKTQIGNQGNTKIPHIHACTNCNLPLPPHALTHTVRLRMFSRFLRSHTCTSRSAPPVAKYREPPVKARALTSVAIAGDDDDCACVRASECTQYS